MKISTTYSALAKAGFSIKRVDAQTIEVTRAGYVPDISDKRVNVSTAFQLTQLRDDQFFVDLAQLPKDMARTAHEVIKGSRLEYEGTSKLYAMHKPATKAEARALKIGDIIECYYVDSEEAYREMVIETCESSKKGEYSDIRTIDFTDFGYRTNEVKGPRWLNTDKFRKVDEAGAFLR